MGVCIYYRGRLRRPEDVVAITNELEDICCSAKWEYHIAEPEDQTFRGITFQPHPESESVWMLFHPDGTLAHPFTIQTDKGLPWSWTKTQFAGADAHIALCRLLHYLSERWFATFEVKDETEYYHTGDSRELHMQISTIDAGLDALADGLSAAPLRKGESLEDRITRILKDTMRRGKE